MIATTRKGTKTPGIKHDAGWALWSSHLREVGDREARLSSMGQRTLRTREIHHLVLTTFSSSEVILVPNLDERNVGGLSKGYHQT